MWTVVALVAAPWARERAREDSELGITHGGAGDRCCCVLSYRASGAENPAGGA